MPDVTLSATPHCTKRAKRLLLFNQTVDGLYLPVLRYNTAVDFIQQPVKTGSAEHVMPKLP